MHDSCLLDNIIVSMLIGQCSVSFVVIGETKNRKSVVIFVNCKRYP